METKIKNEYASGIIGALLGALIGAIPWYLLETFVGYFAAILGYLIAYAAFFGYKKLGGAKKTVFALTVIIISCIIAVLAAEYASQYTIGVLDPEVKTIAAEYGLKPGELVVLIMRDPQFFLDILPNLLLGLLFCALGMVSSIKPMKAYFDSFKETGETAEVEMSAADEISETVEAAPEENAEKE